MNSILSKSSRGFTALSRAASFRTIRRFSSSSAHKTLSAEHIIAEVKKNPKEFVKLAAFDIDGIPRGKYVSKDKLNSAAKDGLSFCSVVFGWDSADVLYDNTKVTGWHMGYSDFPCKVDLTTYRKIPWEEDIPFFIMDFEDANGKALEVCPRNVLKKVIKDAGSMGYLPLNGFEFEFFNYQETTNSIHEKGYKNLTPLTPGMFGYSVLRTANNNGFFESIMKNLPPFGIPVEGLHTETGPGVYEAAIKFSEGLESADRAVLFKMSLKELGLPFGIMPSFMAKPNRNLPGCGSHMHQNLVNIATGSNAFYDAKDPSKMSKIFQHYLAGQLKCLPELMPMVAPTINSYKRLVEGYWAPTKPTWGIDNRTVSYRVIPGGEKAIRVEVRIGGSDMNPYLGLAASLASGLYGIRHKLELPPGVVGNGYADKGPVSDVERLPKNLFEAATRMSQSKIAKELFGDVFVDHLCATRIWEWRQFQAAVTDWETERYFEII